jgi:two-component system, OmpR family, sensor histidine kinase VicK
MTSTSDAKLDVFKEMGDYSSQGIIIFSRHTENVSYMNGGAGEMLGLSDIAEKINKEALLELVVPEDREYVLIRLSTIESEQAPQETEVRIRNRKNEQRVVCCNAFLLKSIDSFILFMRDISKPKQHEDYLVAFGAKKNTILDTLVHHISGSLHLNKHLAAQAFNSMSSGNETELKSYLSLVSENNIHCLHIISELLRDEHAESPHIFVKESRIDVVQKISAIYEELQRNYRNRDFNFEFSRGSIMVVTDETKLLQIVNNFVSNAIKFSLPSEPVTIRINESDEDVIISVSDNGIGIPAALIPYVFDKGSRSQRSGLNGEKSSGMGLSICKRLVELLKGQIWFETSESGGTTFFVKVPKQ